MSGVGGASDRATADLVSLIAEVLQEQGIKVGHSQRLAQVLVDRLGLREQEQWVPVAKDGTRWAARTHAEAMGALSSFCPDDVGDAWKLDHIERERRWVSGWEPMGGQEVPQQ